MANHWLEIIGSWWNDLYPLKSTIFRRKTNYLPFWALFFRSRGRYILFHKTLDAMVPFCWRPFECSPVISSSLFWYDYFNSYVAAFAYHFNWRRTCLGSASAVSEFSQLRGTYGTHRNNSLVEKQKGNYFLLWALFSDEDEDSCVLQYCNRHGSLMLNVIQK